MDGREGDRRDAERKRPGTDEIYMGGKEKIVIHDGRDIWKGGETG